MPFGLWDASLWSLGRASPFGLWDASLWSLGRAMPFGLWDASLWCYRSDLGRNEKLKKGIKLVLRDCSGL